MAGVAGVTEIVGTGEATDFAGVWAIFIEAIVVVGSLVIVDVLARVVVFGIVGVLVIDVA